MEDAFVIGITSDGGASKQSALCRMVLCEPDDVQNHDDNPKEPYLSLCIMAVLEENNNTLACWSTQFSCQALWNEEWHMNDNEDGEYSTLAVWGRAKQLLSASDDDEMNDMATQSTQRLIGKEIVAHWSVDALTPDATLHMVAKAHLNQLWRKQWEFRVPPASVAPSDVFGQVVLEGLLQQRQAQQTSHQQLTQQLHDKERACAQWKETAETLKAHCTKEKGKLLQNFLRLYNAKQDQIAELQQRVQQLEQEQEVAIGSAACSNQKMGTVAVSVSTALHAEGVPDDDDYMFANVDSATKRPSLGSSNSAFTSVAQTRLTNDMSRDEEESAKKGGKNGSSGDVDDSDVEMMEKAASQKTGRQSQKRQLQEKPPPKKMARTTRQGRAAASQAPSQSKATTKKTAAPSTSKRGKKKKQCQNAGSETEEEEEEEYTQYLWRPGSQQRKRNHFDTSSEEGSETEDDTVKTKAHAKRSPQAATDENNSASQNSASQCALTQDKLEAQALLMEDSSTDDD